MALGENIKKLRLNAGLTPTQLADKSGVSRSHLVNIESGKRPNPTQDILEKIASGLNTTVSSLYDNQSSHSTVKNTSDDEKAANFLSKLIDNLIENGTIKSDDIDRATLNLLVSAIKVEIKNKLSENKGIK